MTDNALRARAAKPSLLKKRVMPEPRELTPYGKAGMKLIPLHRFDHVDPRGKPRGKSPRDSAWTVRDYTDFDAEAHMAEGCNVGVRLSAEWVVLDADPRNYPAGRNSLDELAKRIGFTGGEAFCADNAHVVTGSDGFHIYMRKSPETSFVKELKDEHPGIEFKSLGSQVVAAGSIHPDTLKIYRWGIRSLQPSDARPVPNALIDIASRKDQPASSTCGSGLKLSIAQVRHCLTQLPPERFENYADWLAVGMACHHATDGDPEALEAWIEWSTEPGEAEYKWSTFHSDRPTQKLTGYSLFRMVESHGGTLPPQELGEGEFEPVEDIEPIYTDVGDEWVWVADAKAFVRRSDGKTYDEKQFESLYGHLAPKGTLFNRIVKNTFSMRKFESLSYQPGKPEFPGDGTYNLWRNSGIEPKPGDVSVFLDHVAYLVPDPCEREIVLDYLAHLVQRPGDKINFAMLIQGAQGTGKSALGSLMERIIGAPNISRPTNQELRENFTGWLRGCSLVIIEELMTGGSRELANKLKPIITDPKVRIREMYRPSYSMANTVNLLIFTNYRNAVQVDFDDRRYFVVFSPAETKPEDYYCRLFSYFDGEGPSNVAHWLLSRDISGFSAKGRAPTTAAKVEMRRETMGDAERCLAELFEVGDAPFDFDLVSVEDIRDYVPEPIARNTPRLGNIIGGFLREEAGAVKLDGRSRVGEKMKVLWALRNHDKWRETSAAERGRLYGARTFERP